MVCADTGQMGEATRTNGVLAANQTKFHFAQGTPPHITPGHYDVPIPTVALLAENRPGSLKHARAAEVYIALCELTEIVGDILPTLYHLRAGDSESAAKQASKAEKELQSWERRLPSWCNIHGFEASARLAPGLANLQLSFLSVQMLIDRICWHEISSKEADPHPSWLKSCQKSADEMVQFVTSLHPIDFRGFW